MSKCLYCMVECFVFNLCTRFMFYIWFFIIMKVHTSTICTVLYVIIMSSPVFSLSFTLCNCINMDKWCTNIDVFDKGFHTAALKKYWYKYAHQLQAIDNFRLKHKSLCLCIFSYQHQRHTFKMLYNEEIFESEKKYCKKLFMKLCDYVKSTSLCNAYMFCCIQNSE